MAGAAGAKGDQGERGPTGLGGAVGPEGSVGSQGATGTKGDQGDQGVAGVQGATGSVGATIRLYLEKYEPGNSGDKLFDTTQTAMQPLVKVALSMSKLTEYTGREEPTVIT